MSALTTALSTGLSALGGIAGAVSSVAKAVSAAFGFAQRQQDKQAGIDAQAASDLAQTNKVLTAELAAANGSPSSKEDLIRKLGDGTV